MVEGDHLVVEVSAKAAFIQFEVSVERLYPKFSELSDLLGLEDFHAVGRAEQTVPHDHLPEQPE